jgi:hypothetical protein
MDVDADVHIGFGCCTSISISGRVAHPYFPSEHSYSLCMPSSSCSLHYSAFHAIIQQNKCMLRGTDDGAPHGDFVPSW